MEDEIWIDSPSVPGYSVSSHGRIMCKKFLAPTASGGIRSYGGKPWLGCWAEKERRMIFRFRGKTYKVHRVICEAFHGPPAEDQVCMHVDENPRNNRPENLMWGTQEDNLNADGFLSYCSTSKRGRKGRVLPDESIREIRQRKNESQAALARELGVSACFINNVIHGRSRRSA